MTTTRFVESDSANEAIEQALAMVESELLSQGRTTPESTLEVAEIREDDEAFNSFAPGYGFTFFVEE